MRRCRPARCRRGRYALLAEQVKQTAGLLEDDAVKAALDLPRELTGQDFDIN